MTETLEFAILSPRKKEPLEVPTLFSQPLDNAEECPYCHEVFALVIGCHKLCLCGYMEGCQD